MIVAGLGFRKGVTRQAVLDAIKLALDKTDKSLDLLAAPAFKSHEACISEAAAHLKIPLVLVPQAHMEAMAEGAQTRSERVVQLFGVPSIAETVALAAAGARASLIVPRIAHEGVTCALASSFEKK